MALPTLTPASNTSLSILPITGATDNVNVATNPLPYGIYITKASSEPAASAFISGAVDQVAYVYQKLGGDILDIELTEFQVYAAYEEAVLEYSYIVNVHQAKNAMSDFLGNPTGTFDQDGEMVDGEALSGSNIESRYPRFNFEYAKRVGRTLETEGGFGGEVPIYSASFTTEVGKQDYDLQAIIQQTSTGDSDSPFYNVVGDNKVTVRKVFIKPLKQCGGFMDIMADLIRLETCHIMVNTPMILRLRSYQSGRTNLKPWHLKTQFIQEYLISHMRSRTTG